MLNLRKDGLEVARGVMRQSDIDVLLELAAVAFSAEGYPRFIPPHSAYSTGFEQHRWVCLAHIQNAMPLPQGFSEVAGRLTGIAASVSRKSPASASFVAAQSFVKDVEPAHYDNAKIVWHRDADAGGTSCHADCVNVWVPLDAVGDGAPSLQFVASSHKVMRRVPTSFDRTGQYERINDTYVAHMFPRSEIVTPKLEPGDVVIFDHHTLHRTELVSSQPKRRRSVEHRVAFERSSTLLEKILASFR